MPGAGKSTVGKFLAEELSYTFIDLDDQIEQVEGKEIKDLFSVSGEDYFRQVEMEQLRLLGPLENAIIATGGGAPCFHGGMQWMNNQGLTIFLNRPLDLLIERTSGKGHRPLIGDDAANAITEIYKKRISCYQKAGMESNPSEPYEILDELHSFLSKGQF